MIGWKMFVEIDKKSVSLSWPTCALNQGSSRAGTVWLEVIALLLLL